MNILIVSPHFQPAWDWGGPVRSMWNLAKGLVQIGEQVTVVTTNIAQKGTVDVSPIRIEEGVRILTSKTGRIGLEKRLPRFGISGGFAYDILVETKKCDIVHVNGYFGYHSAECAITSKMFLKPLVISTRGNLDVWSLAQKSKRKKAFLATIGWALDRKFGGVHFTSEKEKEQSGKWFKKSMKFVLSNPVEMNPVGNGEKFRARYNIERNKLLCGIVGRLHKKKGFDIIVPAMNFQSNNDVMLAIIGEDEEGYKGEILELMRRNNVEQKIVFTGHLEGENLIDAYSGLDMLVVPSYEENFSNVVIESSAQGTPCIVSEQVGLSGWVKENSIGIVLPLDIDTWRNEIRKIKKDRIGKIWERKRLRRLTENSFSTRKIAKEMLKNYKKIIEERGE